MLPILLSDAITRLAAARDLVRILVQRERAPNGTTLGDRSAKGLLFVQIYAIYECVVTGCVRALIDAANARSMTLASARSDLLALALDAEFTSIIDGSIHKTWSARSALLRRTRSSEAMRIRDGLFPKDGSHFRPDQLHTIWMLFGINSDFVPAPRFLGHIHELVDNRNRIAHGSDAPEEVGRRYTVADLERRVDDTELLCSHLIAGVDAYVSSAKAFQ